MQLCLKIWVDELYTELQIYCTSCLTVQGLRWMRTCAPFQHDDLLTTCRARADCVEPNLVSLEAIVFAACIMQETQIWL